MTRDEIIRMAREAGVYSGANEIVFAASLERFAVLVAAAEQEECAKVLDDWKKHNWTFEDCAAAIRARSNQ